MAQPPPARCREKALELLARRPHFRRELADKLAARDFPREHIEATLDELAHQGLVADHRHALDLAAGPLLRKGLGPRRVRAELTRRGVDDGVIQAVVGEIFAAPDRELELARGVAARWLRSRPASGRRLAGHLDRKGYSKRVILQVLDEVGAD